MPVATLPLTSYAYRKISLMVRSISRRAKQQLNHARMTNISQYLVLEQAVHYK